MVYDRAHVFVNGESWRAGGRDARLLQRLADRRKLEAADLRGASVAVLELLGQWCEAGWVHAEGGTR
jgi:50S ribosomal protein L16 3-hydroxylase